MLCTLMTSRARLNSTLMLVCVALATVLMYAWRLDESSLPGQPDEVSGARQARSIATNGRDTDGRTLPLYFHAHDDVWLQPVPVYVMALFLKLSAMSGGAPRLAAVAVGVLDVVLMFVLARRVFESDRMALAAAGLLALTPAHVIYSRLAIDALYPVPFVIAWLIALSVFLERPRPWCLFAATACLGIGFYTNATSVLIMPGCVLLTLIALRVEGVRSWRLHAIAAAGLLLPLTLLAPWFLQHPHNYIDTVGRWGLHPAYIRNPLDGIRALTNWSSLSTRVWLFWDFFNPSYLFFVGSPKLAGSVGRTGVFLLSVAVFLPLGVLRLFRLPQPRAMRVILLLGLAWVPIVASTFNERQAIGNELAMLPFAVLIATFGAAQLLAGTQKIWRGVGVCLLILMPLQFGCFVRDYLSAVDTRRTTASRSVP